LSSSLSVDEARQIHPAVIEARLRFRGPGGRAAVGTLIHMAASGSLALAWDSGELSMRLVPGVTTASKPRSHGPYVEHEFVAGLNHIDRKLLELLFDRIARGSSLTVDRLSGWAIDHPAEYWDALSEWRSVVSDKSAKRLTRAEVAHLEEATSRAIAESDLAVKTWADAAACAYVMKMDRELNDFARQRASAHGAASGASAVVKLCAEGMPPHTVLSRLRRLFSPWRPSRDLPGLHSRLVLPFWYRARVVDDGSQRLGG
jgi:hypothetical protein